MKLSAWTFMVFFLAGSVLFAQKPEQIPSMIRNQKSFDYYFEQAVAWQRVVEKSPKDKNAWLNEFVAARYANKFSKEAQKRFDLKEIVDKAKEAIPNSFEYYYMAYHLSNDCEDLYKANKIEPDRPIALLSLQTCYLVEGDLEKANKNIKKWYDKGDWSPNIFRWNYNILASLAPDALMFSWGDNDSYPILALQSVKKVRQDVGLIILPLLWKDAYRDHIFEQYHIAPFGKKSTDFTSDLDYYSAILDHILGATHRPMYLGLAGSKLLKNRYADSLYLVGLTYKFSDTPFDNLSEIQDNYEHIFLLDDLKIDLTHDISRPIAEQMNSNYLPAFLLLYEKYKSENEVRKAKELEQIIMQVAKRVGKEKEISKYLKSK